jgi:UDPglucose--hexose-1-phosphate uridylyltransferase
LIAGGAVYLHLESKPPLDSGLTSAKPLPGFPGRVPRPSPDKVASINHETPAVGFHEVVIESPIHNAHIATASNSTQAKDLLLCFRERGRMHHKQAGRGIEHTVYFKNHGATAGASLTHPHAQVVSTPVVPIEAQRLQSLALAYYQKNRCSLYERVVEEELRLHREEPHKSRLVDVSHNFVAVVPYASPGPYVVNIIPRFGDELLLAPQGIDCSQFTTTSDELLEECATILQSVLRRHHVALDEPCFNLVVQSAPVADRGVQAVYKSSAFYRWHIRITPRLGAGAMAGFELGSGFFSNSHIPENDAAELRAIQPFLTEIT